MAEFRGSTLSLPPPYAEVVIESQIPQGDWTPEPPSEPPDNSVSDNWVPQPPPDVQDLAFMADNRERLTIEIQGLTSLSVSNQEHLYNLIDRIQIAKETLETKKEKITRDFNDWKKEVLKMVEKHVNDEYKKFLRVCDSENKRLTKNITTVKDTINNSKRLEKSGTFLTKTGNAHDLQELRDNLQALNKKVARMDASAMTFTTAVNWALKQPCVANDDERLKTNTLLALGYIYAEEARSSDMGETPTLQQPREASDSEEGATAPPVDENDTPEQDKEEDEYLLMCSFNTKTYKDKARSHPMSFVVTPDLRIIVPDRYNKKVKFFTMRGQLVKEIQHPLLHSPQCVCLTADANIAVSDAETGKVNVFSDTGDLIGQFQKLARPIGIAFNHQGHLLAADMERSAVDVFREAGHKKPSLSIRFYQAPVVNPSTGQPEPRTLNFFMRPQYVAVDSSGQRIVVSDRAAHCIQVHEQSGRFLSRIGGRGPLIGQFNEPYGVTYSNTGRILVADYGNNRVQSLHPLTGEAKVLFGAERGLKFPTCVQQLADGRILVSEYLSGSIKVFGTSEHVDKAESEGLPPNYTDVFGHTRSSQATGDGFLRYNRDRTSRPRPLSSPWDIESII